MKRGNLVFKIEEPLLAAVSLVPHIREHLHVQMLEDMYCDAGEHTLASCDNYFGTVFNNDGKPEYVMNPATPDNEGLTCSACKVV